ncbi:uncharacterized protein LOC134829014 [Culicoides brevitarsis]|uniref:uncharacterized protein LOC134829014 n=1 Tax=Culicoides brevitarsis TaxID=469753 RepID=UPI00307C9ADC
MSKVLYCYSLINVLASTLVLSVVLLRSSCVSAEESKSSSNNDATPTPIAESSNSSQVLNKTDTREKRMLNVGPNFHPKFYSNVPKAPQPAAQRRSSDSAGAYPFNSFNQHSANSYYGHGPQYLEAPEPIIEIIIKDSNDTLPYAAPLISSPKKKKKEEVQVYYVKYKHDQHHGLQVDVPVPAIAPAVPGESHEETVDEQPEIVTLPPLKPTTIRAIIHPESEKFHAHGNVRVSFGAPPSSVSGSSSYQQRHENHARQITEYNNEESALQPVVAHPNSPNSVPLDEAQYSKHDQYFDIQGRIVNNFNHVNQVQPPQKPAVNFNVNQVLPPQKPAVNFHPQPGQQQQGHFSQGPARPQFNQQTPSTSFNPPPPTQNQQHFHFHQQARPQQQQQQFFNGQRGQFPPHQLQVPTKQAQRFNVQQKFQFQQKPQNFQTHQPRPIPIPLHQVQNGNQQFTNTRFTQQQQFQQTSFQSQPQTQPQQQQQSQPQVPSTRPTEARPLTPVRSENVHTFHTEQFIQNNPQNAQTSSVHQGLVQQQAPNLAQQNPQFREHLQHLQYVLPAGGELVQSIPSYEQHITETIQNPPRHQFNQQHQNQQQIHHHQQQQQFHHQSQQPQGQHSFRQEVTPPPLIQKQVTSSSNIGPLAHTIGHLPVEQRQQQFTTARPEFQRLPPQQQGGFNNNGPQRFPQENLNFNHHHQFESRPTVNHIPQGHQPLRVHSESVPLRNQFTVPFNHHAMEPLRDPSEPPLSSFIGNQGQEPRHPFPNSLPLLQRPKPGQSVSTKYSDLFPADFPGNNQQQQQQKQQHFQQGPSSHFSHQQSHHGQGHFIQAQPSTTTTTTQRPTTTEAPKPPSSTRDYSADLPDEVPEDLREQLLSSGILANAQISVLDYDKIGDTSLQDLPPEHLANFFNAGGGAQLAGSEQFETVVKPNGEKVAVQYAQTVKKVHPQYKNAEKTLPKKEKVDLKVVRFDSNAQKQTVPKKYIDPESTVLPTVDLNDQIYNRYLPLKIDGAKFPIPDVAELEGRRISSVVVLAPVDNSEVAEERSEQIDAEEVTKKPIKFIAGDALKQLIKKPITENFRRWLEQEGKTDVDMQSVVLLVTKNSDGEQEIFMYDIATKKVNKLSGELSSAFVNVAESNATTQDIDGADILDSGVVEQVKSDTEEETTEENVQETAQEVAQEIIREAALRQEEEENREEYADMKDVPAEYDTDMDMGDMGEDSSAEGSENIETVVKFTPPIETVKKDEEKQVHNQVMISSGYSVIKS